MGIDINAVKSILSINALTSESSDEAIGAALTAANYKPEEIKMALELLRNPQASGATNHSIPAERKTKTFPGFGVEHVVSGKKTTVQERTPYGGMGIFASIVVLIVATVVVYHSGVLKYAAALTGKGEFCLGIADAMQTEECNNALSSEE